jgi:drug/metabolite transporter (DMT)-like permease
MQKNIAKGILFVGLGASSYGMLATFVKLAYKENFTTAEVTLSQFALGILGVLTLLVFQKVTQPSALVAVQRKSAFQLMLAGTSLGMTSVFYYLAVRYIDVSIGIVLLMQTVWMAAVLESILERKLPSIKTVIAIIIVLIGTFLATNLQENLNTIDFRGVAWGLASAASFTTTMYTSNRIGTELASSQRSLFMLLGGALIVIIFGIVTQNTPFNFEIFAKWGILLALFGTILPPMLLNAGFPHTGISLGSIVASIELPVSVLMAYILLSETVLISQWMGILLILLAIVFMNMRTKK